ncbi:MAG: hypothetical protein WDO71_18430 [Bacteroidota bacterium]
MKKFILLVILIVTAAIVKAQKIDSIYFHLYTDSLKKRHLQLYHCRWQTIQWNMEAVNSKRYSVLLFSM